MVNILHFYTSGYAFMQLPELFLYVFERIKKLYLEVQRKRRARLGTSTSILCIAAEQVNTETVEEISTPEAFVSNYFDAREPNYTRENSTNLN